jgi:NAD(P)-dependent dehydrogenase (short-subunit alcohol dehydrogenase family)
MAKSSSKSTIVLITGANQGIGFEIAKKLAREHPDYHVLLGSRNPERGQQAAAKLQAQNLSVEAITIDVCSDSSIAAAAKLVEEKFGKLDVLINNAGIGLDDKHQSGEKTLRDTMLETYNTNVFGAMVAFETFAPLLEKSPVPRVVFMSSSLGSFRRNFLDGLQHPVYRSSKTTLNMLCFTYAQMYRERGWKINACCPGYVATNLNAFMGGGTVESGAVNAVRLATLGVDGETGTYSSKEGLIPW